jgi:hypothetical protein
VFSRKGRSDSEEELVAAHQKEGPEVCIDIDSAGVQSSKAIDDPKPLWRNLLPVLYLPARSLFMRR